MITIKNIMINPNLVVFAQSRIDIQTECLELEIHFANGEIRVFHAQDKAELESWKALLKG